MNEGLSYLLEAWKLPRSAGYPNPFAYEERFGQLAELHKEKVLEDCKGHWKIYGLCQKDIGWNGEKRIPRYDLCMKLQNKQNPKLFLSSLVYMVVWENDTLTDFKKRIKSYTGYMPQPKTLKAMYELVQAMISALKERDMWYAMQDKEIAKKRMSAIRNVLVKRYRNEEQQREVPRNRYGRAEWLLYITKEEETELKEAQRIINGEWYLDERETTGVHQGIMGLVDFIKSIVPTIQEIEQEKRKKKEENNKSRLLHLLDTQPQVRKLIAHYRLALKEARQNRSYDTDIQLIHQLYGYTMNEPQYYQKHAQFREEYLEPFQLSFYDIYFLNGEAKRRDEILPVVQPHFHRTHRICYGDQVRIGDERKKVIRVGVKYLYVYGNTAIPIASAVLERENQVTTGSAVTERKEHSA